MILSDNQLMSTRMDIEIIPLSSRTLIVNTRLCYIPCSPSVTLTHFLVFRIPCLVSPDKSLDGHIKDLFHFSYDLFRVAAIRWP